SAVARAIGPAAFVMVNLSNNGAANRDFTSPPQWAIMRNLGALWRISSRNRGLSHVVIRASAAASLRLKAVVAVRAESLSHLNKRFRRAWWAGGKKDSNKSCPAETTTRGRMRHSLPSFRLRMVFFIYYLLPI